MNEMMNDIPRPASLTGALGLAGVGLMLLGIALYGFIYVACQAVVRVCKWCYRKYQESKDDKRL